MKSLEIINKMTLDEAKKIELKKQESKLVELSDFVNVVSSYNSIEKNYNSILKETQSARTILKKALELLQEQQKLTNKFNDTLSTFDKKAKDLGIDWKTTFPEFIKYQNAIQKQYGVNNFKDVLVAYDNL